MRVSETRRLKQLEDVRCKLKRLLVELTLDKSMLKDALRNTWRGLSDIAWLSGTIRMCVRCRCAGLAELWASGVLLTDFYPSAIRRSR